MKKALGIIATCISVILLISAIAKEPKMLRHVVLLQFKEGTTAGQIKTVEDAFLKLPGQIKVIKAFEWGTNSSFENLNEGLTHCFFISFSSDKDRDAYLIDPAHKAFVAILTPYLEKPVVLDYWTKDN